MLKIAHSHTYKYSLPEGHRFPMSKYDLLPQQLLYEGTVTQENFFAPEALTEEDILRVHTKEYWEDLKNLTLCPRKARKIGFPLTQQLVHRGTVISGGTIQCAKFALEHGISLNIAGGTHHSFTDRGEGFCLLNDIAIAAKYLLHHGLSKQILVVDLDVHQGNGTAEIFWNDPKVFTFSMHGANNYPLHKENSDLDIGLPDDTEDATYLKTLAETLPSLLEKVQPDFIFYLSGVDVLATDKLGRLGLSIQGCRDRDRYVFETCKGRNIPVAVSMGGGYSESLATIINAHANTYRLAMELFF